MGDETVRGNTLAKIFRRIADAIEKLDDAQLDQFLSSLERREPLLPAQDKQKARISKNKHAKIDPVALQDLLAKLNSMSTRSAGADLLDQLDLSRKQLEALARLQSIHFTKSDDVARIKEKLIETTIGARLSSRAIRGVGEDR
jgi:hypothetical protein